MPILHNFRLFLLLPLKKYVLITWIWIGKNLNSDRILKNPQILGKSRAHLQHAKNDTQAQSLKLLSKRGNGARKYKHVDEKWAQNFLKQYYICSCFGRFIFNEFKIWLNKNGFLYFKN